MNMNNQIPSFPRPLTALLLASILMPLFSFLLAPSASVAALLWPALIAAMSLSIWVGKPVAAKALAYIFYFFGIVLLASLLLEFISWWRSAFVAAQAAIYLITAKQLLNSKDLAAYLTSQSKK